MLPGLRLVKNIFTTEDTEDTEVINLNSGRNARLWRNSAVNMLFLYPLMRV